MEQLNFENPWRHRAGSDDDNEEGPKDDIAVQFGFDDRSIRAAFVAKVFALVTVMFAITAAFSAVPIYNKDFKNGAIRRITGGVSTWQCRGVFFIFYITLMCCGRARRCFPCNLFILTCFTFSAATMTMFITATYSADAVLISLLITTGCSASIILFAATTKKDLTSCLGVAFILGICLMLFGLMACIFCIFLNWQFLYIVYAVLGALLCMFYLAIDIQLIMGGRRVEISPEEYIFAATHVFVDILGMFLNILGVVGNA